VKKLFLLIFIFSAISACSSSSSTGEKSILEDQATIEYDLLYHLPEEKISFEKEIQPILDKRCTVCHGCYDAPCQLKLSSKEGLLRGANPEKIYDGIRINASSPTRLFIDANSTAEWRQKNFHPVLNEGVNNPRRNLEDSVLYKMLRLKQQHPQSRVGMLPEKFDISLDRKQSCATVDSIDEYMEKHPEGGMPYALPNLDRKSYTTLVYWLAQGAPVEEDKLPSKGVLPQIKKWETFLNGSSNKQQLFGRYIYEHLFHAHLHFKDSSEREFYRLVRSSTPPGAAPDIIATRRPYGSTDEAIYYRLVRHQGSVVAKQHLVYELSDARMQRYQSLFLDPDYVVENLPGYEPALASNPIKTFADIPVKSRYKFLLDDARFFIEGFIKGPVCRGQIALNVIEDQFWVVFFDPDADIPLLDEKFLRVTSDFLASPTELEDNLDVMGRSHYKELFQKYIQVKRENVEHFEPRTLGKAMALIWDGNGKNPNAALTIFRHFDSASVNFGLIGDYPETAWVIDYSVLERIHYLLVAGFDVYGNIGHQLNTRFYMDFLRTEGEDHFLAFMPVDARTKIRNSWYKGIREGDKGDAGNTDWLKESLVTGYVSAQPQRELYLRLEKHLSATSGNDFINRCYMESCVGSSDAAIERVNKAMRKAAKMDGAIVRVLPDLAFLRVMMPAGAEHDLAYSLISNKAYKSVSSMFSDESSYDRRDFSQDTQTVVPWLEGAYPNFFYAVELADIEKFVTEYNAITNREQYEIFVARFGVRRTDERFWEMSDWFNAQYKREQPVLSGIFDLNRYQNR